MIPIFLWSSLCSAIGLLHMVFPDLFPTAADYAVGGVYWVRATVNNTRRLIRNIMVYSAAALVIWFGLLALAIYTKWWPAVVVGFVSTGMTALLVAVLLFTANKAMTSVTAHILAKAKEWSDKIPIQTVPWHVQPALMRYRNLAGAPLYGLYLLLVLPTKAVLEIIKAIAELGPTFEKWFRRITVIVAAVSVCSWFLTGLLVFQLEFGMNGPLDIFTLGISCVFIATLISLLLMTGSPMVKVLDFIKTLGFLNLFMLVFVFLHHWLPDFMNPLTKEFASCYHGVIVNIQTQEWIAMIVLLVIVGISCLMPWCRLFAGPLALGLNFFWVFSTDFHGGFYKRWEWWATLVILLLGWLFMNRWKIPTGTPSNQEEQSGANSPATAATPAANASSSSSAHGSHGFWPVFAFIALLVIAFLWWHNSGSTAQAQVSPPQVVVMQQAPPAPVPAARQTVTNLEDFAVLKDGSSDGVWEFQLDARQPWRTLPVSVSDGDEVEFSASGLVCGGINVGCVGPNGQDGPTKTAIVNRDEFPVGEAFAQALVARIGYGQFQAGGHKTYVVPDGTGQQPIELMDNYRMPYIALASGGFRVKITIRKK